MYHDLAYYYSLTVDERVRLPLEEYKEYLMLDHERHNKIYQRCMACTNLNPEDEVGSDDYVETESAADDKSEVPLQLFSELYWPYYKADDLRRIFLNLPVCELLDEFMLISQAFEPVSEADFTSVLYEYLAPFRDIAALVIVERLLNGFLDLLCLQGWLLSHGKIKPD